MERGSKAKEKFSPLPVLQNTISSTIGLSRVSEYGILRPSSFVAVLTFFLAIFRWFLWKLEHPMEANANK